MNQAPGYLYHGTVMHRRMRPVSHLFSYRVVSMLIDLDRIEELNRNQRWFSVGKFNVFSFNPADFGDGRSDTAGYIRQILGKAGHSACGKIHLLFFPRILGYAFNPLAVYYCYSENSELIALVYEVRNTFGGKHSYLISADGDDGTINQYARKVFHVSPFMKMDMIYNFRLSAVGEKIVMLINQYDAEGVIFKAALRSKRQELSNRTLMAAFVTYPLMTIKIVVGIHWEALKLFLKGVSLQKAPADPEQLVSIIDQKPYLTKKIGKAGTEGVTDFSAR